MLLSFLFSYLSGMIMTPAIPLGDQNISDSDCGWCRLEASGRSFVSYGVSGSVLEFLLTGWNFSLQVWVLTAGSVEFSGCLVQNTGELQLRSSGGFQEKEKEKERRSCFQILICPITHWSLTIGGSDGEWTLQVVKTEDSWGSRATEIDPAVLQSSVWISIQGLSCGSQHDQTEICNTTLILWSFKIYSYKHQTHT